MKFSIEENASKIALKIKSFPREMEGKVDRAAENFIQRLTVKAKLNAPDAESQLKKSIRAKRLGSVNYEVIADTGYARAVEDGSQKGGWPTLQSLVDWLKVRGIKPYKEDWNLNDLAYAIRQKIYKNGTPAQPFMRPAFDEMRPQLDVLLKRYLAS